MSRSKPRPHKGSGPMGGNLAKAAHKGSGPWRPGVASRHEAACGAVTIRDPEDPRWDPALPDTYVKATCVENLSHKGWHLAEDGYAWHPDDDLQHVVLAP